HRSALRDRGCRHCRVDLLEPWAWLSGADRRHELRHHQRVRRDRGGDAPGARRQSADEHARSAADALAPAASVDDGDLTQVDATKSAATTLLEVRQLGKRFAQRQGRDKDREPSPWVIQDLSFSVRAGEFLTIVGPSGAGKSTLLNIIAQIDTASAGEIVLDGTPRPSP